MLEDETAEGAESGEVEEEMEIERRKPLKALVDELQEWEGVLKEKEAETPKSPEARTITNKVKKLQREISERTLGGQIYLTLNEERVTEQFKRFWLEGKVLGEIDYPIFFAVNQKPVKDNSGEYRYQRDLTGEPLMDEYGHPLIDHDLDEIAEAFVKFAKEQGFDFWRG